MHKKIAVVGAGIIGLSSALKILQEHKNIKLFIYYEKSSPNTTGDVSGGWCFASKVKGNENDAKRWFQNTLKHWERLNKTFSSSETGVCPISGFVFEPEEWSLGVCGKYMNEIGPDEKEAFLVLDEEQKSKKIYRYNTWSCNCLTYLPWLTNQIKNLGGVFIQRQISSLKDLLDHDVVVNCTGLGARELVPDTKVYPVKGQVYTVRAPWIKHFYDFADNLYVLPKVDSVIVGGTRFENDHTSEPDPVESKRMWEECCKRVPSLKTAEILQERVGYRPTRDPVRLEIDSSENIVHCYGHGGAGVTLSWGCAEDVSKLVTQLLLNKSNL